VVRVLSTRLILSLRNPPHLVLHLDATPPGYWRVRCVKWFPPVSAPNFPPYYRLKTSRGGWCETGMTFLLCALFVCLLPPLLPLDFPTRREGEKVICVCLLRCLRFPSPRSSTIFVLSPVLPLAMSRFERGIVLIHQESCMISPNSLVRWK
jgi:hypothetical protein